MRQRLGEYRDCRGVTCEFHGAFFLTGIPGWGKPGPRKRARRIHPEPLERRRNAPALLAASHPDALERNKSMLAGEEIQRGISMDGGSNLHDFELVRGHFDSGN